MIKKPPWSFSSMQGQVYGSCSHNCTCEVIFKLFYHLLFTLQTGQSGFSVRGTNATSHNFIFFIPASVFITLISSLNKFLKNKDDTGEIASLIFMAIIFVITAVKAYRDLKIPKYVKKD